MKRSRIMLPLAAVLALCALTVLADLRESTGAVAAVFRLEGETIASVSANAAFTVTKDNASTYNVYWETDQYKVQNKVGDNKNLRVGLFGL